MRNSEGGREDGGVREKVSEKVCSYIRNVLLVAIYIPVVNKSDWCQLTLKLVLDAVQRSKIYVYTTFKPIQEKILVIYDTHLTYKLPYRTNFCCIKFCKGLTYFVLGKKFQFHQQALQCELANVYRICSCSNASYIYLLDLNVLASYSPSQSLLAFAHYTR